MTQPTTVFDYVKKISKFLGHEEEYLRVVTDAVMGTDKTYVDGLLFEQSSISTVENNVLESLKLDNNFICKDMVKGMKLRSHAFAKCTTKHDMAGSIKHERDNIIKFGSEETILLEHNVSQTLSAGSDERFTGVLSDEIHSGRIRAAAPNLGGAYLNDVSMAYVDEIMRVGSNMKHIFLKGYLYLMDYNLAIASGSKRMRAMKQKVHFYPNISSAQRWEKVHQYNIVVDTDQFIESELGLLNLMGAQYPAVKFGENNIYNSINMSKDSICFISGEQKAFPAYTFKSPTEMLTTMYNLACKLDAVVEFMDVIKEFRGVPRLLRSITETTGENSFSLKMPLSRSYKATFGEINGWKIQFKTYSNYFATSVSLIADYMVGEAMMYSTLNILEDMCAVGVIGMPTGNALLDQTFNSFLRDYGLKEDNGNNILLMEWEAIKRCDSPVIFGAKLKSYMQEMAALIKAGKNPYLNTIAFDINATTCTDTIMSHDVTWDPTLGNKRLDATQRAVRRQGFAYMMGMIDRVPRVGKNALGMRQADVIGSVDRKLEVNTSGEYKITDVSYTIEGIVTGRTEYDEEINTSLNKITYPGTRGKVVVGLGGKLSFELTNKDDELLPDLEGTLGIKKVTDDEAGHVQSDNKKEDEFVTVLARTPGGAVKRGQAPKEDYAPGNKRVFPMYINPKRYATTAGLKVQVDDGHEERKIHQEPVRNEIPTGTLEYTRCDTKGDGACGIHAIAQDLVVHGYIRQQDLEKTTKHLIEQGYERNWHTQGDLAHIANSYGFGLSVLTKGDKDVVYNYGTSDKNHHNIWLELNNGHYSNIVPGGNQKTKISKSEVGQSTEASYKQIEELKHIFKSGL